MRPGEPDAKPRPTLQRGPGFIASRENPFARRTPAERRTTATGRSPGSRVAALHTAFPDQRSSGLWRANSPLTVAGAAQVSHPSSLLIL